MHWAKLLGVLCLTAVARAELLAYYTVAGPPSHPLSARVIFSNDTTECPHIYLDKEKHKMEVRATPSVEFPVLVCSQKMPGGVTSAEVVLEDDQGNSIPHIDLPVLHNSSARSGRMLFVGDTGCLLKGDDESRHQDCNNRTQWPWQDIAERAALENPEVVVHVGDYVYRVQTCPVGDAGCENSSFGDVWESWNEDFFTPAAVLLQNSVWIPSRGNHEACNNMGPGFFRLLHWGDFEHDKWCMRYTAPYAVDMPHQQIIVMDTSEIVETELGLEPSDELSHEQVDIYKFHFQQAKAWAKSQMPKRSFIVSHRPMWGLGHDHDNANFPVVALDKTMQAAAQNHLPENEFVGVIAGHIHFLQHLHFNGGRQPQFVFGNSGSSLAPPVSHLKGRKVSNATVTKGTCVAEFGYSIIDPVGPNGPGKCHAECSKSVHRHPRWHVQSKTINGTVIMTAHIEGAKLATYDEEHPGADDILEADVEVRLATDAHSDAAPAIVGATFVFVVVVAMAVHLSKSRHLCGSRTAHVRMV